MSDRTIVETIADLAKDDSINQEFVRSWLSAFRASPGASALEDFSLTELQKVVANDPEALRQGTQNLVIAGPTSAGKTLAAEILMARVLTGATPPYGCVYAVPLRALATEKWQRFKAVFGDEDVYVSSGDYQDQDSLILNRRFRIAVVVYEKLYSWWLQKNSRNAIISNMGLLIIDELQMLGDIQRGPRLELLLTFLRRLQLRKPVKFRLIGLGPKREALAPIAEWLGAKLLASVNEERPVPLAEGYICPGRPAQFVGKDPRVKDMNVFVPNVRSTTRNGMLKDIVSGLLERNGRMLDVGCGKRVLVYSPTKDGAERLAALLADTLGIRQSFDGPTSDALDALERTHATARLRQTMAAGVGFHHGDLTFGERGVVERLFRAESPATCLDVVVCTPTLAMGVNLPADYMLFSSSESFKPKDWDERENIPTPLTPLEYHSFAGRAGRYRPNAPPDHHGVALFISERTDDETRREIVEPIILGKVTPVASEMQRWPFGLEPLALAAAESLGAELVGPRSGADVRDFFVTTYAGIGAQVLSGSDRGKSLLVDEVVPTLDSLAKRHEELITPAFAVGLTGNVVARAGIHIKTYEALKRIVEGANTGMLDHPLKILEELAIVPEIVKLYPTSLSDKPKEQAKITRALRAFLREMSDAGHTLGPRAEKLLNQQHVPDRGTLEALMRVTASWLWIEGCSAEHLSSQEMLPGIRYGACNLLGDQLHWLVSTLPDLWDALGVSHRSSEDETTEISEDEAAEIRWAMGRLERRLRFGVPNHLVGIAQLRVPGLHRENMMKLWQAVALARGQERGWDHPVELLDVPAKALKESRALFRALQRAILSRPWSDDPRPSWQKQIDIARLASDGDGKRYVDADWTSTLKALWTEDDSAKLSQLLARALVLKPIRLNVTQRGVGVGVSYFILESGRVILLCALGDGSELQWEQVRALWGAAGPTGAPVDSVLVLANGEISHLSEPHKAYGKPIRIVTKEALGYLIVQSLVAPEEGTDAPGYDGPKPMAQVVRDWLCADTGNLLVTAKQAETTLKNHGIDPLGRDARWFQGRARPKQIPPATVDVRERTARDMKVEILRKEIEQLALANPRESDTRFFDSLTSDLLTEVDRLESEPTVAATYVRKSIEELAVLCLTDHGITPGGTLESMLETVRTKTGQDSWARWATIVVRPLSNPAHHATIHPDGDGRFRRIYTFAEAQELLSITVRLWRDYLSRRPVALLTEPAGDFGRGPATGL